MELLTLINSVETEKTDKPVDKSISSMDLIVKKEETEEIIKEDDTKEVRQGSEIIKSSNNKESPKSASDSESPSKANSDNNPSLINTPLRRHLHIRSEQRRRERITDGFHQLKQVVPTIKHSNDSKAQVLRKTVEYIDILQYQNSNMLTILDKLKNYTMALQSQIQNLGDTPYTPSPELSTLFGPRPAQPLVAVPQEHYQQTSHIPISQQGLQGHPVTPVAYSKIHPETESFPYPSQQISSRAIPVAGSLPSYSQPPAGRYNSNSVSISYPAPPHSPNNVMYTDHHQHQQQQQHQQQHHQHQQHQHQQQREQQQQRQQQQHHHQQQQQQQQQYSDYNQRPTSSYSHPEHHRLPSLSNHRRPLYSNIYSSTSAPVSALHNSVRHGHSTASSNYEQGIYSEPEVSSATPLSYSSSTIYSRKDSVFPYSAGHSSDRDPYSAPVATPYPVRTTSGRTPIAKETGNFTSPIGTAPPQSWTSSPSHAPGYR